MVYTENINTKEEWDSTYQLISWWGKDKIKAAKVMVIGAGVLGNEVLKNLALLGIGHLFIVDYDIIKYHNTGHSVLFRKSDVISRKSKAEIAAQRLKEISPDVKTQVICGDIYTDVGLGIFRRMDAIIGCTDNHLTKIAINRYAFWVGKPWIDGGLKKLMGQVAIYKQGIACYESNLSENTIEDLERRFLGADLACRNAGLSRMATTIPILSSVIGAIQAQEAIKLISGNKDNLLLGKQFVYHSMLNNVDIFELSNEFNERALSNQLYNPIIEVSTLSNKSSFEEVLDWAMNYFYCENPIIKLPNRVAIELVDIIKDEFFITFCSFPKLSDLFLKETLDYDTRIREAPYVNQSIGVIGCTSLYKDKTLEEAGIPPLHIIEIIAHNQTYYLELTKDLTYLEFQ